MVTHQQHAFFVVEIVQNSAEWDTWLSAIVIGRTAATIAELCFGIQCAFIDNLRAAPGAGADECA